MLPTLRHIAYFYGLLMGGCLRNYQNAIVHLFQIVIFILSNLRQMLSQRICKQ